MSLSSPLRALTHLTEFNRRERRRSEASLRRKKQLHRATVERLEARQLLTLTVEGLYVVGDGGAEPRRDHYELTADVGAITDQTDLEGTTGDIDVQIESNSTANYGFLSTFAKAQVALPELPNDVQDREAVVSAEAKMTDQLTIIPEDAGLIGRQATMTASITVNGSLDVQLAEGENGRDDRSNGIARWGAGFVTTGVTQGKLEVIGSDERRTGTTDFPNVVSRAFSFTLGQPIDLSIVGRVSTQLSLDTDATGLRSAVGQITVQWSGITDLQLLDGTPLEFSEVVANSESGFEYLEATGELDEYRWDVEGTGSFGEPSNWDRDEVPGVGDMAIFGLPERYTVRVGDRIVERVMIGGSPAAYVEFEDTLLLAQSTDPEAPGIVVNQGEFHLLDGVITSNHALVGETAATRVELRPGGVDWQNNARFVVGGGGEAEILVRDGSRVVSPVTLIGDSTNGAFGKATVRGTDARWITDDASVGSRGPGSLMVSRGGLFRADGAALIGGNAGFAGAVSVEGGDASGTPSQFLVEHNVLDIGSQGVGTFDVLDGALVESNALLTRVGFQGAGSLLISGTGDEGRRASRFLATRLFAVGVEAPGEVVVEAGGQLDVSSDFFPVAIGAGHQGDVFVSGRDLSSKLVVRDGPLIVGSTDGSTGHLTIEDGGLVQLTNDAGHLILGRDAGSRGELVLLGDEGVLPSTLELRSILEVGGGGTGAVEVHDGSQIRFVDPSVNFVRAGFGGSASIEVSGRDSESDTRSQIETGILNIGANAPAELTITDAGLVSVSEFATVGGVGSGEGRVVVQGADGGTPSEFVTADLTIGGEALEEQPAASGELTAQAGGLVRVLDLLTINPEGVADTASGAVTIGVSDPLTGWVRIGSGGTLTGTGTIFGRLDQDGGVDNFAGRVIPGFSPGTMTIEGDYRQGPEGTLVIEIGGPGAGTEYDQLVVSGDVTLNGTLELQFIDGYVPGPNDSFEFVVSNFVAGQFEDVTVTGLPTGLAADLELTENGLRLDIVAEVNSRVSGRSFDDLNGDGVRQSNEPWMNGWMIHLLDRTGSVVRWQTTSDIDINGDGSIDPESERGWYQFEDLPAGRYYLQQSPQDGWHQTGPYDPEAVHVWELDRDHDFRFTGNLWEDWGGRKEKWFWGKSGWYFATPNGTIYEWDGSPASNLTGDVVTQLTPDYAADAALIYDAHLPVDSRVSTMAGQDAVNIHFGNQRDEQYPFQKRTGSGNVTVLVLGTDLHLFGDRHSNGVTIYRNGDGYVAVGGHGDTTINRASEPFGTQWTSIPDDLRIWMYGGDDTVCLHDVAVADHLLVDLGAGSDHVLGQGVRVGGTSYMISVAGDSTIGFRNSTFAGPGTMITGGGQDLFLMRDVAFDYSLYLDSGLRNDQVLIEDSRVAHGGTLLLSGGDDRLAILGESVVNKRTLLIGGGSVDGYHIDPRSLFDHDPSILEFEHSDLDGIDTLLDDVLAQLAHQGLGGIL